MKKVLFLSTFFALSFLSAQAQGFNPNSGGSGNEEPSFSIAPKAGFTLSKYGVVYADPDDDQFFVTQYQTGFTVGLAADIPFGGSQFGIQAEVLYAQRGSQVVQDYANLSLYGYDAKSISIKEEINYIEIPLLFKYKIGGEATGMYLVAGPGLNFGLGASLTESGTLTNSAFTPPSITLKQSPSLGLGTRPSDTYRSFDLSLLFGVGGYFKVGNGKFFVDVRYALGLNNIVNKDFDENSVKFTPGKPELRLLSSFASEVRNRSIQFSVGYFFPIGGSKVW
jgi:hypothetical protein